MRWYLVILPGLIFFSACNTSVNDEVDLQAQREVLNIQEACARGECPCETPVGNVAHGSKITTYTQASVGCHEGCGSYAEELTCDNGEFDKDITGVFFKCFVEECPACRLGNNLILSGESVKVYSASEVGCRESCEDFAQTRTCEMGVLSGSDDYHFATCKRKECRCELPDGSGFLSLDGEIKLYDSDLSDCRQTCDDHSQVRTCMTNAAEDSFWLDGNAQYRLRRCDERPPCTCIIPTLPSSTVLAHEEEDTLWKIDSVRCAENCAADPANFIEVKCMDGQVHDKADNSVIDFAVAPYVDYVYSECNPGECVFCEVPVLGTQIPHGGTYRFYKDPTVGCGVNDSCHHSGCNPGDPCNSELKTCNDGNWVGTTGYVEPNCTQRACECDLGGGNSVQVGSSKDFYLQAQASCGSSCPEIRQPRTCLEVEDPPGTYNYEFGPPTDHAAVSCDPPSGCECALPNDLGSIQDGKEVSLTSLEEVPCGQLCEDMDLLDVICDNGILKRKDDGSIVDPSAPGYVHNYFCTQGNCDDCVIGEAANAITIPNNSDPIRLFSKEALECQENRHDFEYEFECQNGTLLRNGQSYDPTAPGEPPIWYTSIDEGDCPGCDLPWGARLAEGGTIKGYKFFGTVINNCGRGCKVSEFKCEAGELLGDPSYDMDSCDNSCMMEGGGAPPRVCLLPYMNSFVTPDSQVGLYSKRQVASGESCQDYFKLGRCEMETGTFDVPFDYIYQTCTELDP